MSITSMCDAKLMNEQPSQRPATSFEKAVGLRTLVERPQSARGSTPRPPKVPPTVLGQLVRWIPTESLTLYVAFLGVLDPIRTGADGRVSEADFTGRWVSLGVFLALTVVIVLLVHVAKVRRTREPFRWPVFEMVVSSVAFVAWAMALTDTPLQDFSGYKIEIGAFIVLATTAMIGLVADALDRNLDPTPIDSDPNRPRSKSVEDPYPPAARPPTATRR